MSEIQHRKISRYIANCGASINLRMNYGKLGAQYRDLKMKDTWCKKEGTRANQYEKFRHQIEIGENKGLGSHPFKG